MGTSPRLGEKPSHRPSYHALRITEGTLSRNRLLQTQQRPIMADAVCHRLRECLFWLSVRRRVLRTVWHTMCFLPVLFWRGLPCSNDTRCTQAPAALVPIDRIRIQPVGEQGFTLLRLKLRDRRQGSSPLLSWVFQRHLGEATPTRFPLFLAAQSFSFLLYRIDFVQPNRLIRKFRGDLEVNANLWARSHELSRSAVCRQRKYHHSGRV